MRDASIACKTCLFFVPTDSGVGDCHRNPPMAVIIKFPFRAPRRYTMFAGTHETDWCGAYAVERSDTHTKEAAPSKALLPAPEREAKP